jgi:uncharacterized caspase-like protein
MRLFSLLSLSLALASGQPRGDVASTPPGGQKQALVIGNDSYAEIRPLKNARSDARSVRDALVALGFEVDYREDISLKDLRAAIDRFVAKLDPTSAAFVYYAGHGVQVEGLNYLIPVDFRGESREDIPYAAYPASLLLDKLQKRNVRVRILVLDACRTDPFPSGRDLMRGKGLAPLGEGAGTIVAFATQDGQTADDNSLFQKILVSEITQTDLDIRDVFRRVKEKVFATSGKRQLPWVYDGLVGPVMLAATGKAAPSNAEPGGPDTKRDTLQLEVRLRAEQARAQALLGSVHNLEQQLQKDGFSLKPETRAATIEVEQALNDATTAIVGGHSSGNERLLALKAAVDALDKLVRHR